MTFRGHGYEYYAHVDPDDLDYAGQWNNEISYPPYHEFSYRQTNGQSWPQTWDAYGYYNTQRQAQQYDYYAPEARRWSPRRRDPSPSSPPIPTAPSVEYLELSQQPSTHIDDSSSSRKLLILDLNGTLLYREPQGPRRYRRDRVNGSSEPLPRVAHPRPYMGSFRQYLFHPKTLEWLDTMVWSSAQPFNVGHMVDQCFRGEKEKLIAVWARDTLGLTPSQYHQKTQTTKDLAKPWAALSSLPGENDAASASSSSQDRLSHPTDEPALTTEPSRSAYAHSALTTLLLDDSPLKAQLQPWNHFCVPEYTAQIRGRDLSTRHRERDQPSSDVQDAENDVPRKKRKKPKKALGYDQILLAVIGVLNTIKGESNVSGWMRQCGLWNGVHGKEDPEKSITHEESVDEEVESSETRKRRRIDDIVLDGEKALSFDSETPGNNSPAPDATSISPKEPSARLVVDNAPPSSPLLRTQSRSSLDDSSSSSPKRKKLSLLPPPSSPPLPPSSQITEHDSASSSPRFEAITLPGQDSKPEDSSTSALPQPPDNQHLDPSSPSPVSEKDKLWFENEAIVSHWAKLGLNALAVLGIPAEAGI